MKTISYEQTAIDFATKHNIKLSIIGEPEYKKYFSSDKQSRFVFKLRLSRNKKTYTFNFGQSITKQSEEPSLFRVLACLNKYDVGSFEYFCSEFGYNSDSRTAERTYKAVCKEFSAVERLFSDIMEELQEIS